MLLRSDREGPLKALSPAPDVRLLGAFVGDYLERPKMVMGLERGQRLKSKALESMFEFDFLAA